MTFADDLTQAAAEVVEPRRKRPTYPPGMSPGVDLERGTAVVAVSEIPPDEAAWREQIENVTHLPLPDDVAVTLTEVRYWGDPGAPMVYCKFRLGPRPMLSSDLDELVKAAKVKRKAPSLSFAADNEGPAYVVALGDLQVGKPDGDGTDGIVSRFMDRLLLSVERYRSIRRTARPASIYLPWLGDCIEGVNSQGGAHVMRLDRTPTEQVRIVRRLMLEQVKAFAGFGLPTYLVSIPGNHDEAHRIAGKMATRYDDSWAVDAASAVGDALALAGTYDNVQVVVPARDELTITLDVAGTITTFAHGHQFGGRPDASKWWAGQAHGMQPAGDSTLLMSGHFHHLRVIEDGRKTWMQVPAMDGGSTWYRHRTGLDARPGVVTMLVADGGWSSMEVL